MGTRRRLEQYHNRSACFLNPDNPELDHSNRIEPTNVSTVLWNTRIVFIDDSTDSRVSFFSSLKGHDPRLERRGVVLVEGDQQVERLLRSSLVKMKTLFMETRYYRQFEALICDDIECLCASRDVMEQIVGYRLHQGVMALAQRPAETALVDLTGPIVALNGIIDPENVGGIVRSCAAFGVTSILVDRRSAHPWLRRAIRVSMGTGLDMNVCCVDSLAEALQALAERYRIIAIENTEEAAPLQRADWPDNIVLIFGNERSGIDADALHQADTVVRIGMETERIGSLNVCTAAAIVLCHLWTSRQAVTS